MPPFIAPGPDRFFPLTTTTNLEVPYGATFEATEHLGKKCVELTEPLDPLEGALAILPNLDFKDGVIEFDAAGTLTNNAASTSRSFVGIAFRGSSDMSHYDCFYLRMTNGRSPIPEMRRHAVQYCSPPEYTWDFLRAKRPYKFEAHTDLQLGVWTHVKIVIHGNEGWFYVGNGSQPCLTVHDLLGRAHGRVALWADGHTHAFFAKLKVKHT